MFEDNLSKCPPHFFCGTQERALHFVTCKSHSSPTLITQTHPQAISVFMHHRCTVSWHWWCQGKSCPSTSQCSGGWNSFSRATFSLSWPRTPPLCPVQEPVPPFPPSGWPRRLTVINEVSVPCQGTGPACPELQQTNSQNGRTHNQHIPVPGKQRAPFWDLPRWQKNITKSKHLNMRLQVNASKAHLWLLRKQCRTTTDFGMNIKCLPAMQEKSILKGPRALPGQSLSAGIGTETESHVAVPVSLVPALM